MSIVTVKKLNAAGEASALINAEGATTWQIFNIIGQKRFEISRSVA